MNSTICVDANLVLAIVLGEKDAPRVETLWRDWITNEVELIAPTLFAYEVTSVIHTKVYRKLITSSDGLAALQRALNLGIQLIHQPELHDHDDVGSA